MLKLLHVGDFDVQHTDAHTGSNIATFTLFWKVMDWGQL